MRRLGGKSSRSCQCRCTSYRSDTVPRVGGPRIEYDMDRELFVLRGGPGGDVRVDDRAVPPEVTVPLRSQSLVRVGDREFYFLLPR